MALRAWLGRLADLVWGGMPSGAARRALALLILALILDYGDRALIGALGPTLKQTFHFGNAGLGVLAAAFSIVGACATIPLGILTDRTKRTRLLAISMALWTGAMALTGAAVSFAMLFAARLFLGIVAAATGPAVPSLIGDLVPGNRRARHGPDRRRRVARLRHRLRPTGGVGRALLPLVLLAVRRRGCRAGHCLLAPARAGAHRRGRPARRRWTSGTPGAEPRRATGP